MSDEEEISISFTQTQPEEPPTPPRITSTVTYDQGEDENILEPEEPSTPTAPPVFNFSLENKVSSLRDSSGSNSNSFRLDMEQPSTATNRSFELAALPEDEGISLVMQPVVNEYVDPFATPERPTRTYDYEDEELLSPKLPQLPKPPGFGLTESSEEPKATVTLEDEPLQMTFAESLSLENVPDFEINQEVGNQQHVDVLLPEPEVEQEFPDPEVEIHVQEKQRNQSLIYRLMWRKCRNLRCMFRRNRESVNQRFI